MTTSPAAPSTAALPVKHDHLDVIYVSGGMTGHREFNYPAFRLVTVGLRAAGYTVYDPTERIAECGTRIDTTGMDGTERLSKDVLDLRKAFAEYAAFITTDADAIAVLPGWERSKGAVGEVMLGRSIGLAIIDAYTGEPVDAEVALHQPYLRAVPVPAVTPAVTSAVPSGGEIRTVSATGGAKGVKEAQHSLIPPGPLKELAVLYGRGNIKYPPEPGEMANWMRGYEWSKSYDALKRHLDLWWSRTEDHDPEMGVKHLICVAWHAFNLAWFMENRNGPAFDDRPSAGTEDDPLAYEGALPMPQFLLDILAERAAQAS